MAGLTPQGFVSRTLEELENDLRTAVLAAFPAANVHAGVLHQLISITASKLRENWELAEAVYAAGAPSSAEGIPLVRLAEITGTRPLPPSSSRVPCHVELDTAVTLPAGSQAHVVGDPGRIFASEVEVENTTGAPATFQLFFEALETGPVEANAGTLTQILTPVAGWTSVTNILDAELGRDLETPEQLRARREAEIRALGGGAADAIRAELLRVAGVTAVRVFENLTNTVNGAGMPPHSLEALVLGGDNDAIANALWRVKGGGIRSHGDVDVMVEDSRGDLQEVWFRRPVDVLVHLEVDIDVGPEFPVDGAAQVETRLAQRGDEAQGVGDDVVVSSLYCAIFAVPGVRDVTAIRLGTSPSPVGTSNIVIGPREIARFDTSRITVTPS